MATNDDTPVEAVDISTLVHAVLRGDRSAYAILYDRYVKLVGAICYDTTHDVGEAMDLSQEVFLRAFLRLRDLRKPDRFGAWLLAIARRVCQEWRRRRARTNRRQVAMEMQALPAAQSERDDEAIGCLHRALLQLPEKERLAIQAFYLLEEPPEQVRTMLQLSRPGLYRVLKRARNRLKRLMQGRWEYLP
jgi:RNA polymerase sigma-70 factor (ECF subfamily)